MKGSVGLSHRQAPGSVVDAARLPPGTRNPISSRVGAPSNNMLTSGRTSRLPSSNPTPVISTNSKKTNTSRAGLESSLKGPLSNSPYLTRKSPHQTATSQNPIRDSVTFRRPINPATNSVIKGEKETLANKLRSPSTKISSTTTTNITKRNIASRVQIQSPTVVRKAASSLGVNTLGVTQSPAKNQRNAAVDEGQAFVKKGNVTASRSVDSLSTKVQESKGASFESDPFLSQQANEVKSLRQKVDELEKQLELREKDLFQLRVEYESRLNKPDITGLAEELENLRITSFLSGSQSQSQSSAPDINDIDEFAKITEEKLEFIKKLEELQIKNDQLNKKYQDKLQENLCMSNAMGNKDVEINKWKEKYQKIENDLNEERKAIAAERLEWKLFQDDLLTVVRAANDYKTEAVEKAQQIETENERLRERIHVLEANSKGINETTFRRRVVDSHPLLTESKSNNRDASELNVEVSSPEITTVSFSFKEDNPPSAQCDNNKENCVANVNGYNNMHLENENKFQNINTNKRLMGQPSFSKKLPEKGSLSLDQAQDDDPLVPIVKYSGGSKRNALLRWCQSQTASYRHVDITNFSTSWNDGMALCALLHSLVPDKIPYETLSPENRRDNFEIAFKTAESASIPTTLSIDEMVSNERPSWEKVMNYIKDIYIKLGSCD